MFDIDNLLTGIQAGNFRSIAQAITMVENNLEGTALLLQSLPSHATPVIGITGPPGAGKSTLVNALLRYWTQQSFSVAVLSVDPSSPFNLGALLGDRIRMSEFYLHDNVYIRSLASRGSLGGLNISIIEIIDVLKAAHFDFILVETVGVGQSEIEIAGIADTTVVVMVPEAGDEVQTMKAGVMEIADIFVVNKGDRANADEFVKNLRLLSHGKSQAWEIPVIKCIAQQHIGIDHLHNAILSHQQFSDKEIYRKYYLFAEKAFQLIQRERMKDIDKHSLVKEIEEAMQQTDFNLYRFVANKLN